MSLSDEGVVASTYVPLIREEWTEERTEELKRLYFQNFSSAQIAAEMGNGLTRNAILGKIHRLELKGGGRPSGKNSDRKVYVSKKKIIIARAIPRVIPKVKFIPVADLPCLTTLSDVVGCRYPSGDAAPYLFCDAVQQKNSSYCPTHHHVVYVPAAPSKNAGRPGWR